MLDARTVRPRRAPAGRTSAEGPRKPTALEAKTILYDRSISCPYCGEYHELLVEPPSQRVRYTEDCSVCCQPIEVMLTPLPEGGFELSVRREND